MFAFNIKKFLQSGQYADVEFTVTPEKYPVSKTFKSHRQLLALRNEVFGAMFHGTLPEKGPVVIKDLHPDGFYGLLKHLYKGKPNINSVEKAAYTRAAARKYLVPELELACTLYIKAQMKAEHVCRVTDCCVQSDGGDIDDAVDLMLKKNPEAVLSSDAFTNCLDQTVHYVLDTVFESRPPGHLLPTGRRGVIYVIDTMSRQYTGVPLTLELRIRCRLVYQRRRTVLGTVSKVRNVPEMCVLLAVHLWAQDYCQRSATADEKPVGVKTAIAPFLSKLRFLALTVEEFVSFMTSMGAGSVVAKDDAFDIVCVLTGNKSVELPSWVCREKTPR